MTLPLSYVVAALTTLAASLPVTPAAVDTEPRLSFAEPALSPDGREIVFTSGGDIWTVPAQGGEARLLVSHPATERKPIFSPDGSKLAFTSLRTGNGDVYVLTLKTGELDRITFDDGLDLLDGWSRDGKYLYFSSTSRDIAGMNDVYRVSASGGTPMIVAGDRYSNEYWSAAAPDGRSLAITARGRAYADWWRNGNSHIDESEIWIVSDVAPGSTGAPRYLPITTGGAKSEWPMWSADGSTVYFVSNRGGTENLWSRTVSGGEARKLTSFSNGRVIWPSISNDGRAITFERDFEIWTYDLASGTARKVPIALRGAPAGTGVEHLNLNNGFRELALSPDGKKVAFTARGEIFAASSRDGGDAARVTNTPGAEGQPTWAPDSRRIVYTSDRNGGSNLYLYDFVTRTETQLTRGNNGDVSPQWSPDGKSIAYIRDAKELRVIDPATGSDKPVAEGFLDRPPFLSPRALTWSPDGKWIAFLNSSGRKLFGNAYVVSANGGDSRPVSFLPTVFTGSISWSPDGTYLLMDGGQRTEPGQLVRIDLVPRTPRFREDQFRDLFPNEGPRRVSPALQPVDTTRKNPSGATRADSAKTDSASAARPARKRIEIVFDGIRLRSSNLPVGVDVNSQSISPDGKYVLLTASAAGQQNLYVYPLDELSRDERVARQITSTSGNKNSVQWSPDGKEVWYIENGRVSSVNVDSRATRSLNLTAEMDIDFSNEKMAVFNQGWRFLRDNFFDEKMNGVDWNAARAKYGAHAAGASTHDELRRTMQLMIGELNASHTGANSPPATQPYTGRLGLYFDRGEYEKNGRLKVSEIVALGPASISPRIKVGDVLTKVDGKNIEARTNLDELLSYKINRQTNVTFSNSGGSYDVSLLPVNQATDKRLIYRDWVEDRRAYVSKVSGGKLGYVHMLDMSAGSLTQLAADLDAENSSKDGVVIDVRNNNGGFVNAYALDIFSRRPYLTMQPRGLPAVPARTQLGQRSLELPTVLVTNQMSLSDAEDFTEGYRALGLGKVVGEPTAGWIIYTSDVALLDGTLLRLPFIRITDSEGKDMEMHPRPVDVEVIRPVGESYTARDSQLDAAVQVLLRK
ncbi:MAG TPA: S41 family peptidase [Gemmatimonadaceae bacterium]|nr:S41 family peptidase [Gemmatimonadaceae bacterium]